MLSYVSGVLIPLLNLTVIGSMGSYVCICCISLRSFICNLTRFPWAISGAHMTPRNTDQIFNIFCFIHASSYILFPLNMQV